MSGYGTPLEAVSRPGARVGLLERSTEGDGEAPLLDRRLDNESGTAVKRAQLVMQSKPQRVSADKRQRHLRTSMQRFVGNNADAKRASGDANPLVFAHSFLKWAEPLSEFVQPLANRGRERLGRPRSRYGLLRKPRRRDQGEQNERCHAEADAHAAIALQSRNQFAKRQR